MGNDVIEEIEKAVSKRRTALQSLSLREVGRAYQLTFQIPPDWPSGKENLIERILAKFGAELERNA